MVYETEIANTISQFQIDRLRSWLKEYPSNEDSIYQFKVNGESSDEEIAMFLAVSGDVIEQESLKTKIVECGLV